MLNRSFAGTFVHSMGTNVLTIGIALLTSIFIARLLGPQGKGAYDLVIATSSLFAAFLGFSLFSGVTYIVASAKAGLRQLSQHLVLTALIQVILASLFLSFSTQIGFTSVLLPTDLGIWVVGATVIHFGFQTLSVYWRSMMMGLQNIIVANHRDLLTRLALLVLLVFAASYSFAIKRSISIQFVVLMSIFTAFLANLIWLHALWPTIKSSYGPGRYSDVIRYSLPSYLGNLVQFLNYRADIFFVNYFLGVTAVGLYALAVSIAQLIWLISGAVATVLFPRVAASQIERDNNAVLAARACRFAFWFSLGAGAIVGATAYVALPLVYGEAFGDSITPLLLLLPGIVGFSIVNVLGAYIAGMGKPQINMLVAFVGLIVTLTGNLFLIPRMGIAGAALVSTGSYLTSALLTVVIFSRSTLVTFDNLFVFSQDDVKVARRWIRQDLANLARVFLDVGG